MHPLVGRLSLLPERPAEDAPDAPWRASGVAVVWTVATSLGPVVLVVLVGWLASGLIGGLVDPFRLAVDVWLAAHGVPLELAVGSLTLHPLGLTLLILVLLWRGGRWAGRRAAPPTFAAAGRLVAMLAVGYGSATALLAYLGNGPAARPDVLVAAVAGVALAAVLGGLGVLSGAALLPVVRQRIPLVWRVAIDAGWGAALALAGLAALVLAGALVVRHDTAYDLAVALGPDAAGWPVLLLLNVLLAPNAVLAALAYATGPGFAVGVGTSVSMGGSDIGPLPPLSLFAAVPGSAHPHAATYALLAIPLLAGIAAGLLAVRRSGTLRPEMCALAGLGAGVVAGVLAMAATWAASGGLGAAHLAMIGATGWAVGGVVAAEIGAVAAATAWVGCPRTRSAVAVEPPVVNVVAGSATAGEAAADELTVIIGGPASPLAAPPAAAEPAPATASKPDTDGGDGDGDGDGADDRDRDGDGDDDHADEPNVVQVRPALTTPVTTERPRPASVPAPATHSGPDGGEDTVILERQTG